jgi:hypothetical protein
LYDRQSGPKISLPMTTYSKKEIMVVAVLF